MSHYPSPEKPDIVAEQARGPELGHLVEALDFRGVIEWAKTQGIEPYEALDRMVGSTTITIDGQPATVGYVQPSPSGEIRTSLINIENSGGEDVVIVEGSLAAAIYRKPLSGEVYREARRTEFVRGRGPRPGFLQLDGDECMELTIRNRIDRTGLDESVWYVCFYPEAEAQTEM